MSQLERIHQRFREFWRTESWVREQSAAWAERHYPADVRPTAAGVMYCLMEILLEDPDRLSPTSAFHEDIEMPALLDVELTMAMEEEFKLSIPDEDAFNIRTLGELIEYVRKRLHA